MITGGHTSEALALIATLDPTRYTPRRYIVSEGDSLSAQKAVELEKTFNLVSGSRSFFKNYDIQNSTKAEDDSYDIVVVPRARRVHQSLLSTPPTALWSLLYSSMYLIRHTVSRERAFADVLVLNGPGTCFTFSLAIYVTKVCSSTFFRTIVAHTWSFYLDKLVGCPVPKIIYVESFARVKTLSLSGKLLRPFVDR